MSTNAAALSRLIISVTAALLIAGLLGATGSSSVSTGVLLIGSLLTPFIALLLAHWSVGLPPVSFVMTALGVWVGVILALTVVNRLVPAAVSVANAAFPAPVIVGLGVALVVFGSTLAGAWVLGDRLQSGTGDGSVDS